MLTIIHCNDDFIENISLEKLKEKLRQFHTLDLIFDNFNDPLFNNYYNPNIVLRKCINSDSDSLHYLQRIENALSNLIKKKKLFIKNGNQINIKFINRMTSSNSTDFLSVISEIFIADNLLSLFGSNNFEYEKGRRAESKPDFRITANGKQYDFELRKLMKGTTKEKIETIFNEVCVSILGKLKNKNLACNISIRLDTAKLCINQDRQIDIERSKNTY